MAAPCTRSVGSLHRGVLRSRWIRSNCLDRDFEKALPAGFEPALTAPEAASLYRADQRKHGGGRTGRARMGRGAAVIRALRALLRATRADRTCRSARAAIEPEQAVRGCHNRSVERVLLDEVIKTDYGQFDLVGVAITASTETSTGSSTIR